MFFTWTTAEIFSRISRFVIHIAELFWPPNIPPIHSFIQVIRLLKYFPCPVMIARINIRSSIYSAIKIEIHIWSWTSVISLLFIHIRDHIQQVTACWKAFHACHRFGIFILTKSNAALHTPRNRSEKQMIESLSLLCNERNFILKTSPNEWYKKTKEPH